MKIIEILDSPIAFHRCLAEITGSANAGLLLSQAIYWQNRPTRASEDGWWYKSREEWYSETCLSRKELETARRACSGVLLHKKMGVPPYTWYKVDVEELEKRLLALPSRTEPLIRTETVRLNGPKETVYTDQNVPYISTEINTETKAENIKITKSRGSLEEVIGFCNEIGLKESDGDWFFNKCEGNGWINGKLPIKDWRATVRAWKSAGYMPSQRAGLSPYTKPKENAAQAVQRILKGI